MQGQLVGGRPVKINRNTERKLVETQSRVGIPSPQVTPIFDRWNRSEAGSPRLAPTSDDCRLYVGGLPCFPREVSLDAEMKALFKGYNVQAVSSPHTSKSNEPGSQASHSYAFVDFATAEEAADAARVLDETPTPHGGKYKIRSAQRRKDSTVVHRLAWEGGRGNSGKRERATSEVVRRDFLGSWRRQDGL
jgi:RNA recognition motif-containing protein